MLSGKAKWEAVRRFAESVMSAKEDLEREREGMIGTITKQFASSDEEESDSD